MAEESRPTEVHLFAAARAAAGTDVLHVHGATLGEVMAASVAQAPGLAAVLERCSILVDGVAAHEDLTPVRAGARVDVLPPFAGG